MPYYEVLCLANAGLTRRALTDLLRSTVLLILDNGGIVTRIEPLGSSGARELAYRIRRNQKNYHQAFFINICAITSPKLLKEVERRFTFDDRIIRYLSQKLPLKHLTNDLPDPDFMFKQHVQMIDIDNPEFESDKFIKLHYPSVANDNNMSNNNDNGRDVSIEDATVLGLRKNSRNSVRNSETKEKADRGLKYLLKEDQIDDGDEN